MAQYDDGKREHDPRPKTVGLIGCLGLTMLAICIPLAGILAGPLPWMAALLPLAVIVGLGISIIAIWLAKPRKAHLREIAELQRQLAELNERLTNLETMDSFERRLAFRETQAAQQSQPVQSAAMPDPIPPPMPQREQNA